MTQMKENMYDVVIIGGGPAGLTAALYLARARYRVIVVEKESFGGQVKISSVVANYPGVEYTTGAKLAETMQSQAESFGAKLLLAEVNGLDVEGEIKRVRTSQGELCCFGILLAAGAHPRKAGFRGEEEFQGHGVAYCATCDGEFFEGKEIFVVGGGYAAAEESVFLTKYARHVTMLIRGEDFRCAKSTADAARNHEKITVLTNTRVREVSGDTAVRVLTYENTKTGEVTEYREPDGGDFGVFVFVGYEPETELVRGILSLDEQGYVQTDRRQKTSVEGVYAAGDICVKPLRQVATAVGDGALAATELERYAEAMREKTGIHPAAGAEEKAVSYPMAGAEEKAVSNPVAEAAEKQGTYMAEGDAKNPGFSQKAAGRKADYFTENVRKQLHSVFDKMQHSLVLKLYLDSRAVSTELHNYMEEMASLTEKLTVEVIDSSDEAEKPCVRIFLQDGTDTGLAFHGVPGGHEFTSFVMGLYNAAGPGQAIGERTLERIRQIDHPLQIDIMITLSCSMCPELVIAAQKIASLNPLVRAEIYDITHFPERKEKYHIMSVPYMVINEDRVSIGRKNIEQLLDLILEK